MTNKLLLIGAVVIFLLGGVVGYFVRGVVDPRYQYVTADTTGIHISGDTATGVLPAIIIHDTVTHTSKPIVELLHDTVFVKELENLLAPHGADTSFETNITMVSDSGDVIDVSVPVDLRMNYDPLSQLFSFRHIIGESTLRFPVRRTHEVRTEYSNYWLWFDIGAGYQIQGSLAIDVALGIKDWGVRGVFVESQRPTIMIEKRLRIL